MNPRGGRRKASGHGDGGRFGAVDAMAAIMVKNRRPAGEPVSRFLQANQVRALGPEHFRELEKFLGVPRQSREFRKDKRGDTSGPYIREHPLSLGAFASRLG